MPYLIIESEDPDKQNLQNDRIKGLFKKIRNSRINLLKELRQKGGEIEQPLVQTCHHVASAKISTTFIAVNSNLSSSLGRGHYLNFSLIFYFPFKPFHLLYSCTPPPSPWQCFCPAAPPILQYSPRIPQPPLFSTSPLSHRCLLFHSCCHIFPHMTHSNQFSGFRHFLFPIHTHFPHTQLK